MTPRAIVTALAVALVAVGGVDAVQVLSVAVVLAAIRFDQPLLVIATLEVMLAAWAIWVLLWVRSTRFR